MEWIDDLRDTVVGLDTAPLIYFIEEHPIWSPKIQPLIWPNSIVGYYPGLFGSSPSTDIPNLSRDSGSEPRASASGFIVFRLRAMHSDSTTTLAPPVPAANEFAANPHPLSNRILRTMWSACYAVLYRPTPNIAHRFRVALLRLFGANIHATAHPYPKCKIWAPWNLTMGAHSCLANSVDCYNVAPVVLEEYAIVSQYSYLCSASHDYNLAAFPLFSKPITIERHAWVAARAYVGPGVTVGEGSVVGANSCAYRNIEPWTVVGGNPARAISRRKLS